jgi:autotransporter-associated beta strand protein
MCLGIAMGAVTIQAAPTWNGGSNPNFNWSAGANAGNWTGVAIAATGSSPIFAGSVGLLNTNDFVTSVNGITFNAGSGAFNLYGNALTVAGNFTDSAVGVNETIYNNITWDGTAARTVTGVSGGTLTFAGNFTRNATTLANGMNFVAGATLGTPAVYQFSGSSVSFVQPTQTADVSAAGFTMRNNTTVNLLSGANVSFTGGFWGVGQNGNSTTAAATTLNVNSGATLAFDSTANVVVGYNFNGTAANNNTGIVNVNGTVSAALGTASASYIRLGLDDNAAATGTTAGTINLLAGGVLATSREIVVGANFDTASGRNAINSLANSSGNFVFDGGTLKTDGANDVADWFASANSTTGSGATTLIIQKLNSVKINAGGAFIDTAGRNATISYGMAEGATTGGGLTKQGLGTLTLSGNNTYNGTTTVSAGTLKVDGALAGAGTVTVGAAGTLMGVGTIKGNTTINGALDPGTSTAIGTLTFNQSLTLASQVTLEIDRSAGQNADLVNDLGTLTLGGNLTVNNIGSTLLSGDTFNLFDGTISSSFASTILPTLDSGLAWDTSQLNSLGVISVETVPEPSAAALGVCGGLFMLCWRMKRI